MILPTKHIPQDRALLTIGSHLLNKLGRQKTISALWEETIAEYNNDHNANPGLSYDWFILALDLLYAIGVIEINDGLLCRRVPQ